MEDKRDLKEIIETMTSLFSIYMDLVKDNSEMENFIDNNYDNLQKLNEIQAEKILILEEEIKCLKNKLSAKNENDDETREKYDKLIDDYESKLEKYENLLDNYDSTIAEKEEMINNLDKELANAETAYEVLKDDYERLEYEFEQYRNIYEYTE